MPKPPILPLLDWKEIFETAHAWEEWIQTGESAEHREAMREDVETMELPARWEAWLAALARPVRVVAFAEDWCGDVVRHVPVLQRMARAGVNLQVRYLARAERPEVFARFLANGGEAVPRFIFLSDRWVETGHWGPMPEACREVIARGKACGDLKEARRITSALYDADPERREVLAELLAAVERAGAERP